MLAELAGRVEAQRGSTDRSGEMLAELVRQVEQQRIELRAEHARHIEQQRHLSAQQMERLTMELGKQRALVAELTGSTSWKLTAPLRFMRRLLSWNTAATVARIPGGLARATYRAFLHAWPMRLRLKRGLASEQGREHPGPMETRVTTEQPADGQANGPAAADMSRNRNTYVAISPDPVSQEELRAKLIAFYLPQFHPIPENDEWWGRGFTEWTNVSKAEPQFEGHDQPHLPGELGFYDLRLPEVMHRQIELAQHYGVHGFCFHYYWFDGRRILERPLNQFLSDPSFDFPFCICWANENWTRRWDGQDHDILLGQHHSPESDVRFIQDAELILRDARYIRIDGRPLLIVYRPSILPDCAATLERWRQYCRDVGLGEIFIAMVQFDVEDPREFGFDAAVEFPPHKLARDLPQINEMLPGLKPDFQGYVVDYQAVASRAKAWPDEGFDLIRGVFPGWDNEARKPKQGYLFAHSSPEGYRDWLCNAIEYSRRRPGRGESIVFVNAWNEWAEGAYLEPDRRNGYAYLQATREALTCLPPGPSKIGDSDAAIATDAAKKDRIAVVSHDAHPHGAQYLALNLCRELSSHFQFDVHAVLLGEGVLEGEFAKVATVHRIDNSSGMARQNLAEHLARSGVRRAIANTTVSGLFAAELKRVGIRVVSLVHELPGVIESYGLHEHALAISNSADKVVFAAEAVREGFKVFAPLADSQSLVRAQGLYKRNRYRGAEAIGNARSLLRQRFGLANDTKIVLCVGYADLRKGVDLFVDIGERLVRRDKRIHMVWLGHPDLSLEQQIQAQVVATGFAEHFHFPGRDPDTDPYYAGCDLYALTSREDPFPSVIMEAFDVCVPVVGFASAGGFEALLRRGGGKLAPAFDLELFTEACRALLVADLERERLGAEGKAIVDREFSFREYIRDLLDLMGYPLPRVSVIVPNYNYAHFMGERLQSIADQSLPPYEIIVLDDASTDDSLARLEELSKSIDMRIIANEKNSGSVFQQWRKGIQEARGEFIWIAEADDLSDPDFLKKVLPAFEDERVVMSYCQSKQINGGGDVLCNDYLDYVSDFGRERWCMPFVADLNEELKRGLAIKNTIPNVSAVVFRRSNLAAEMDQHIEDISSYRIAGDWVAYLHLLESGNLAFWPEPLNRHRRHGGSVTIGSSQKAHLDEVLQVQGYVAGKYHQDEATQLAARNYELFLREYFGLGEGIAK